MIKIKKSMEKITEKIKDIIKNSNPKKNKHILILTLIIIILIWLTLYIIPETLASLFSSFLGKVILILFVIVISYEDLKYGIVLFIFLIIIYRFTKVVKKEGFVWSQETIQDFLKLQNTINKGIVFDTTITQKQASEEDAQYFLKNGMWPWNEKVQKIYLNSIGKNPYTRTSPEDSMKNARTIYNESAILKILSLQKSEGKLLIDGVTIESSDKELSYAYDAGLAKNVSSIITCNTKDKNNSAMERRTLDPKDSSKPPTITELDYNDLENIIPGFKFVNRPCNPCGSLNNNEDYSCHYSLKTSNNPSGKISDVWKYLWNIE